MYVVGLTGGIGSGKSAVAEGFAKLGIVVVDADIVAREVVEPGTDALQQIIAHFGEDIVTDTGELDRAALRRCVFKDDTERKWLETLLHPLIHTEIERQLNNAEGPYAVFVSPLLVETDQHQMADRILVVDVPEELQIQRTTQRDNNSVEQVKAIMAAQASRQQRLDKAQDVVSNSGTLKDLEDKIYPLHQHYLKLAEDKG